MKRTRYKKLSILLLIGMILIPCLAFFFIPLQITSGPDPPNGNIEGCTIFTVIDSDRTYFAGNLDFRKENEIIVGVTPPTDSDYGSIHLGFLVDGSTNYEMAMNDQGLAWDINSIPDAPLNMASERQYSGWGTFLTAVTTKASTVEDAIYILELFDIEAALEHCQLHIADATGNAVVIGPGPEGEIVITRKQKADDYLISTNFNLAIPTSANHPEAYLRYDNTSAMLDKIDTISVPMQEYLSSVLESNHFESLITYTLYSYVFDTHNKMAYLYYLSDFSDPIVVNFADEFTKGQRWFYLEDLLLEQERDTVVSKYNGIVRRDLVTIGILVISAIFIITSLVISAIRLDKKIRLKRSFERFSLSSYVLIILAVSCVLFSLILFNSYIYPPNIISIMRPNSLFNITLTLSIIGGITTVLAIVFMIFHIKNKNRSRFFGSNKSGWIHVSAGFLELAAIGYMIPGLITLFTKF